MRCRKGKTKCVYENGRAPCKNCAKGMHECYLPSESMSHGGHHVTPVRVTQRSRESLPGERHNGGGASSERPGASASSVSRHVSSTSEKYVPLSFPSFLPLFQLLCPPGILPLLFSVHNVLLKVGSWPSCGIPRAGSGFSRRTRGRFLPRHASVVPWLPFFRGGSELCYLQ